MFYGNIVQYFFIYMNSRKNCHCPLLTDIVLLSCTWCWKWSCFHIQLFKCICFNFRLIFRIHAKSHQTCNNSGFSSGQNNTARMIPFNRPPQRAHNCMDIFRHRLRKIKRIPLILLKCFQQTKRADMHIMLIPQRTIFPGCQPYAAWRNIHKKQIISIIISLAVSAFLYEILKKVMLVINLLRHIHYIHIKSRIHMNQIQHGPAIFRFSEDCCSIYFVISYTIVPQQLFQPVQHITKSSYRSKRQFLINKYFFPKSCFFPYLFNHSDGIRIFILYNTHRKAGRSDMNDSINKWILFCHLTPLASADKLYMKCIFSYLLY